MKRLGRPLELYKLFSGDYFEHILMHPVRSVGMQQSVELKIHEVVIKNGLKMYY